MPQGANTGGREPWDAMLRFLVLSGTVGCVSAICGVGGAWADSYDAPFNMPMSRSLVSYLAQGFAATRDLFWPIFAAAPRIPAELSGAANQILVTGDSAVLWRAASIVALLLMLPPALRLATSRLRARFSNSATSRLLYAFLFDVAALLAMMFAAAVLAELALGDETLIARLGVALVDIALRVSIVMTGVRVLLRPAEPALRLVAANDAQVQRAMPLFAASMFLSIAFTTIVPLLLKGGTSWAGAKAIGVTVGTIASGLAWISARRFYAAASRPHHMILAGLGVTIGTGWVAWTYGLLFLDFPFYSAVISAGCVVAGAFIVNRFFLAYCCALRSEGISPSLRWHTARALISIVRLAVTVSVVLIIARFLATDFPTWLGEHRWNEINQSIVRAAAAISIAYTLAALINAWIRGNFVIANHYVPGAEFQPGSRLLTIIPLLQWGLALLVLGTGVLFALGELGVNIAPLLAGAGIFGLALSFGAQSLVRDIISGLFYMADDAFRIGEYVQAGQLRGTVESISLRSVRLRHQHGQVHTIPFGQLGSVSNSSRDWLIVKFNLRLALDVDLEVVRKTVKQIGEDLLAEAEFAPEFLEPLKMQGVADVLEAALVVRFKFTVRPGKSTIIHQEALKRIVQTFGERGIPFASYAVVVHGASDNHNASAVAVATQDILVSTQGRVRVSGA